MCFHQSECVSYRKVLCWSELGTFQTIPIGASTDSSGYSSASMGSSGRSHNAFPGTGSSRMSQIGSPGPRTCMRCSGSSGRSQNASSGSRTLMTSPKTGASRRSSGKCPTRSYAPRKSIIASGKSQTASGSEWHPHSVSLTSHHTDTKP